jgi:hypothetical protein
MTREGVFCSSHSAVLEINITTECYKCPCLSYYFLCSSKLLLVLMTHTFSPEFYRGSVFLGLGKK